MCLLFFYSRLTLVTRSDSSLYTVSSFHITTTIFTVQIIRSPSVRIAGGLGVKPPTSGQNSTPEGRVSTPTYVLVKLVCCLIHTSF